MDKATFWKLAKAKGFTQATLAAALEISQAAVNQWSQVPAHHALAVENLTGISRHDLRPDIFGPAEGEAA